MELETRTPDEMLDGAMKRIMSIAEAVIKMKPRLIYINGAEYRFSFDKTSIYTYQGSDNMNRYREIKFPDNFFHYFLRQDGEVMVATKYSESPELIA